MSQDVVAASSPSSVGHSNGNGTPVHTPSPSADPPVASRRPSSSRAIVPTPLSTNITPKIPLATASSPVADISGPSPVGGGPTSASYVVPPRPKPGRKPATDEPASKRKAQNRESQRAFRARKAAKLNDMQAQVENAELRHKQELTDKVSELHEKNMQIRQLQQGLTQRGEVERRLIQERDFWKDKALNNERQIQILERQLKDRDHAEKQAVFFQHSGAESESPTRNSMTSLSYSTPKTNDIIGCGNCKADGECACIAELAGSTTAHAFLAAVPLSRAPSRTNASPLKRVQTPSVDVFAEREIDFTAQFSAKRTPADSQPSTAFLGHHSSDAENCGFCTDDANCMCRDASLRLQESQRSEDEIAPPRGWIGSDEVKRERALAGPGSCPDCQANPRQKAWCQRVAQLRNEATDWRAGSSSRKSSIGSPLETMEPPVDTGSPTSRLDSRRNDSVTQSNSIGCSDAYKLFEGRVPMDSDRMDWISNLKAIPSGIPKNNINMEPRTYSALELDTAGVIATLQNSMSPLVPRKSDGENAQLVRLAEEIRRNSNSPRTSLDSGSPLPISSLVHSTDVSSRNWR